MTNVPGVSLHEARQSIHAVGAASISIACSCGVITDAAETVEAAHEVFLRHQADAYAADWRRNGGTLAPGAHAVVDIERTEAETKAQFVARMRSDIAALEAKTKALREMWRRHRFGGDPLEVAPADAFEERARDVVRWAFDGPRLGQQAFGEALTARIADALREAASGTLKLSHTVTGSEGPGWASRKCSCGYVVIWDANKCARESMEAHLADPSAALITTHDQTRWCVLPRGHAGDCAGAS